MFDIMYNNNRQQILELLRNINNDDNQINKKRWEQGASVT